MSGRSPGTPPDLPGYTHQRLLGSGGFADVYLYEQALPLQLVAVKVLLDSGLSEDTRRRFTDEANTMARFASHPFIVAILAAGVAEDGRPYIVMPYYSRENLYSRCARQPLSVIEGLRVGIQIASALETAHRAGVVHRDVKPANILTDDYGALRLSDFGIAAATTERESAVEFLSIPWSPPEAIEQGGAVDALSDIYSLGATVYTLLTGRSPFEWPGAENTSNELMGRIARDRLRPTGRDDVPGSFERVLARSMSKQPELRQPTALDFARDLQGIEQELRLSMTPVVVPEDVAPRPAEDLESSGDGPDPTRHKGIVRVRPPTEHPTPERSLLAEPDNATSPGIRVPVTPVAGRRSEPAPAPSSVEAATGDAKVAVPGVGRSAGSGGPRRSGAPTRTKARPLAPEPTVSPEAAAAATPHRSRTPLFIGAAVVAAVAMVLVLVFALGGSPGRGTHTTSTTTTTDPFTDAIVPVPTHVSAVRSGNDVTLTWTDPAPEAGDYFSVEETPPATAVVAHTTRLVVAVPRDETPCFTVELVRVNAQASQPSPSACATSR